MHVRVSKTRRGSKEYRSVQLGQTYRNAEGKPVTRVLASLGNLSDLEIANLRQAVQASRAGRAVVVAKQATAPTKVKLSLAFLDVAACYRAWQGWQLSELVDELGGSGQHEVSIGEVIAALTVQRCVAPASKLEASRWYPTTALPELQGVNPSQFNNTRVHRALDVLARIEEPLQEQLARHIEAEQGRFISLFLDCTDTWFVGRGPEMAEVSITKEGAFRRKVGIALMCDQRGLPLRWGTVEGKHHEADTMLDMVDATRKLSWAHNLPVVVDRAMGRGVTIEKLLARDVRFVTAVPAPEIVGYSTRIPLGSFDEVTVPDDAERDDAQTVEQLQQMASAIGFQKEYDRLVLDLGLMAKGEGSAEVPAPHLTPSRARATLLAAALIKRKMDAGTSLSTLSERYDCSERTLQRWLSLLSLNESIQQRIHDEEADRITPEELGRIAQLSESEQSKAYDAARAAAKDQTPMRATRRLARFLEVPPIQLRVIAVFNPQRFIEQRQAAAKDLAKLEDLVETVNQQLRSPRNRMTPARALSRIDEALRKDSLTDAFESSLTEEQHEGRKISQLQVTRNETAWARRRQVDGFTLIVTHPDVLGSPGELVQLYFAKDKVEKDFQTIKSVLALRPVNHQTDSKVRAHVTLCMLALLLQRTMEQQFERARLPLTTRAALGLLETARLNLFAGKAPVYGITEPNPEQRRILAALKLGELADDGQLNAQLHSR